MRTPESPRAKGLKLALAGPPEPTCGAWPSRRSTARCEKPPNHDGFHAGRTYSGYWKFWDDPETTTVRSGPGAGRSVPRDPGSPAGGIGSAGSSSPGPDLTAAATNVRGASAGALPSAEPSRQGRPADPLKLMEQQLCALLDAYTGRTAAERGRGLPPKHDPDPALRAEYLRLHAVWMRARAQGSLL